MTICVCVWAYRNNGGEQLLMKNFLTSKLPRYGVMHMSTYCMCIRVCVYEDGMRMLAFCRISGNSHDWGD